MRKKIVVDNKKQKIIIGCNFWEISGYSAYKSFLYEGSVLYNLNRNLVENSHFFVYVFISNFIKESYNLCISNKGYDSVMISALSSGLKEWLKGNIFSLGVTSNLIYEYGKSFFPNKNHNLEFYIGVEAMIRAANSFCLGRNIYTGVYEGMSKGATLYYVKTEIEPTTDLIIKIVYEEIPSFLGLDHDNNIINEIF